MSTAMGMRSALLFGAATGVVGALWGLGCGSAAPPVQAPLATPSGAGASGAGPAPEAPEKPEAPAQASASAAGSSAPAAPGVAGVLPGYRIDPAALVGCRAPDEPGCASCCSEHDNECERLWSPEDWNQPGMGEPWYNATSVGCPRQCAACASCTKRDERRLAAMLPFRCDCEKLQIGVDPCFDPGSCACECRGREHLTKACPKAP